MEKFIYSVVKMGSNVIIETTPEQEKNGNGQELFQLLKLMNSMGHCNGVSIEGDGKGGIRYELKNVGQKETSILLKNGGLLTIPLKY